MKNIYLAGDMKSGWQDDFAAALPKGAFNLIDPRTHGLEKPSDYTEWDLEGVRRSDYVVALMGPHNPSGFGLSIECGFAHALGKTIVFIDLMGTDWRGRYFDMLREISVVVPSIRAACDFLVR